jgi:hypothetical protein
VRLSSHSAHGIIATIAKNHSSEVIALEAMDA